MSSCRPLVVFTYSQSRPLRWARPTHPIFRPSTLNRLHTPLHATDVSPFRLASHHDAISICGTLKRLGQHARIPSRNEGDTLFVCLAHHRIDAADDRYHVGQKPPLHQLREGLQRHERR